MERQVPGPAIRLSDLPTEVLGAICRPLSLWDRLSLSSTCRTLLHGLASSEDAWGILEFTRFSNTRAAEKLACLLPWLARRRQGLRRLELDFRHTPQHSKPQAAAQLAVCLEGSPLVDFWLSNLELSGEHGGLVLQQLGSCTALTSLTLDYCSLSCLPGALERLPALADLSLVGSTQLGGRGRWGRLAQLTVLTRLDLSRCGLAALPAELSGLPALAGLRLTGNTKLGGASWELLKQLTVLTRLDMSGCELASLPAGLAALPALASLNLYHNTELGAAPEEAWAPLGACSGLTALTLEYIPFERLPPALAALAPCLLDLNLSWTSDGGLWAGDEEALDPLYMLTGLTRLDLSECLEGLPLPEGLSRLVALRDLDLGGNLLGERLALRPLCHLTALTRLRLGYCCLEDVPEEISHLQALKDLDCGNNSLKAGEGINWQRLCGLTALTRLNLTSCGFDRLPPQLAELGSLAQLNLCCNELLGGQSGESAAGISAKWAALDQLTALTHLDASECDLHALPAALGAPPRLRVLCLAGNPSLGRGGMEALRPLVGMTALQHLDLSGCSLPRDLEEDAVPFPLHWLEGWAERIKDLSEEEIKKLRLG